MYVHAHCTTNSGVFTCTLFVYIRANICTDVHVYMYVFAELTVNL